MWSASAAPPPAPAFSIVSIIFSSQLFLRRQVCGVFGLQDVTINLNLQSVFGKAQKSYARGRVFHFRIFDQKDFGSGRAHIVRDPAKGRSAGESSADTGICRGSADFPRWADAIMPFGIESRVRSPVRNRVERKPMSSHHACLVVDAAGVADLDDFCRKEWKPPPNMFSNVFCAPRPRASPPIPTPARGRGHIHAQVAQHQQGHQQKKWKLR